MDNMESLYQGFKEYFDADREKIDYFLDVLKNVKEDKWEYEYSCLNFSFDKIETKTLKYDNIRIQHTIKTYYDSIDYRTDFEDTIKVLVANIKIFETDDETSKLSIKIIDFIKQAEKRAKGE